MKVKSYKEEELTPKVTTTTTRHWKATLNLQPPDLL
jgi:hypothetical protein